MVAESGPAGDADIMAQRNHAFLANHGQGTGIEWASRIDGL